MRLLIVEDEQDLCRTMAQVLRSDGYEVDACGDGGTALELATVESYDLILLDIMMPGTDGITWCKKIRRYVDCPILFLTAKAEEKSIMEGLGSGGDDYICKPFGVMELRARIGAHLRREKREHVARLALGRICFMLEARKMMIDEKEISLTKAEYDICEFLAKNRGQIFSKEQILEKVLGYDSESSDSTIITHIKNIRTKLSSFEYMPIKTVWGIGYKWEE